MSETKPLKISQVEITDVVIAQVFATMLETNNQSETAKQLGFDRQLVRKIINLPKYVSLEEQETEQIITYARTKVRSRTAKQADLVISAMEKNLKDGNMDAVKTWLKTHGLLNDEVKPQGDQSVQIILPGTPQEKSIDVQYSTLAREDEHG